jgi:hypothetical protein
MIADFEQRLSDVLGARLPSPFSGRVLVAPGDASGTAVLVGVRRAALLEDELGRAPKQVPGATAPRRVLHLRCEVSLAVRPSASGGRAEQRAGVDQLLYLVDAPELRDGTALAAADGDPGFLIDRMQLVGGTVPTTEGDAGGEVTLSCVGWFWPTAAPGEAGVQIGEIRVRGAVLPIDLSPAAPSLVAGSAAVAFTLRVRTAGLLREPASSPLPFGRLAIKVFDAGHRPGAGALSGGSAGVDGSRLLDLTDGAAAFGYTPPAAAALDFLVVALDNGEAAQGVELARFPLRVKKS